MHCGSRAFCLLALLQGGATLHKDISDQKITRGIELKQPESTIRNDVIRKVSDMANNLNKDPSTDYATSTCDEISTDVQGHGEAFQSAVSRTGIIEAMSNLMAGHMMDKDLLKSCATAIEDIVVNNHEATKYMWEHTNVVNVFTSILAKYSTDADMMASMVKHWGGYASVCCPEYTPKIMQLGGFASLFDTMDRFNGDVDVQFSAWAGLAEHVNNVQGATAIGNYGGPNVGISKILDAFIKSPPKEPKKRIPFTLRNEITKTIFGLLSNDPTGNFHKAFKGSDLPRELTMTMASELDIRVSQELSCKTINQLLRIQDTEWQDLLAAQGALEIVVAAIDNFKTDDQTVLGSGTITDRYPVVSTCMDAILNLVNGNKNNQEFARRLAITTYLESAHKHRPSDTTLWNGLKQLDNIIGSKFGH